MLWSDFYYDFTEWAESTVRSRISSLEDMAELEEDGCFEPSAQRRKGPGLLAVLMGILSAIGGSEKKRDTGHCDGDCANCPPHYGYRYGRWYYGHGHRYGCQRGGNGGASGRTCRD